MPNANSATRMTDPSVTLPATFGAALMRGIRCRCPRCGEGRLFARWLKPVPQCKYCGLDISGQRADDFPAYVSMFITGHVLAPIIILMALDYAMSSWAILAVIIPVSIIMMVLLLQPSKGGVIALQWWNGMHGFKQERLPEVPVGDDGDASA